MTRRHTIGALSCLGVFALGGCEVGPDYAPPDLSAQTGGAWTDADGSPTDGAGPSTDAGRADLARWWERFDDPEMASLISRALGSNLDLVQARERIVGARARRGIRNADRLPTLDGRALYSHAETGEDGVNFSGPPPGSESDLYSLGVVAGWEVDLWGRVGRLVEAADADIAFAIEDERAARVALAAQIAREVIDIRALDERLRVLEETIALNRESVDIAGARSRAGLSSDLDGVRARRVLEANRASVPSLLADRRAGEHRIATLLGVRPGEVSVSDASLPEPPGLPSLGVPADLITRRPDLRRGERALASATALVGAAVGERYPRLSISGNFSLSGEDAGDVFNPAASAWGIGPTVTIPVLTGGRVDSRIAEAESDARRALASLRADVLNAVREVETALARRTRSEERIEDLRRAAGSADDAERLARSLYGAGRSDFLDVIEAQSQRLVIDDALATARRDRLTQSIDLYAALGGGWEADDGAASEPADGVQAEAGSSARRAGTPLREEGARP